MAAELDVEQPFCLTAEEAQELKARFGTPLYVLSEAHIRNRARRYLSAMRSVWPNSEVSFASKANSTAAVLAIIASEGLGIDVASEGEFRVALLAGIEPERCHMHGNNKSEAELKFAVGEGIGMIMVDNFEEIELLVAMKADTKIALRLAPGVDPITHQKISTGQSDTKFGFNIADGSAKRAVDRCLETGLNLVGIHCHVGSSLYDPQAQIDGATELAAFLSGIKLEYLNVGGGLGVRYTKDSTPTPIEEYCAMVAASTRKALEGTGLNPVLAQEPGRSLVAEAGVTLYSVGTVKDVPADGGVRRYAIVDGGLADNPRPVMYDAVYTVLPAYVQEQSDVVTPTRISGRHCETDKLFDDIPLPVTLQRGDLVQVLCTGAYNASMASNYNRYQRPRAVMKMLCGDYEVVQELETWAEMFHRERIPSTLRHGGK